MKSRLQKLIADSGLCSRRKAEEFIIQGLVRVNGRRAALGESADPHADLIEVNGKVIYSQPKVYFMLNKPPGYECTLKSTHGKPPVTRLIETEARIFPVGRLDADTRGLLLLTNDGDFAHRIIHPAGSLDKEYIVRVAGHVPPQSIEELRSGVMLGSRRTRPCIVETVGIIEGVTALRIILHEGRKRQIRRMLGAIGFRKIELERVRIGPLTLGGLKEGGYRQLAPGEVRALLRQCRDSTEARPRLSRNNNIAPRSALQGWDESMN